MLDLYIPTFGRAYKLKDVHDQIWSTLTDQERIWFIIERTDTDSLHACTSNSLYYIINHRTPNYAGAINSAWDCLQSEYFFAGADDLWFSESWLEPLRAKLAEGYQVVGTNDGGGNNEVAQGIHATHYAVAGKYITEQGGVADHSAPVLFEGYDHNFTDTECIGTAKDRGVFTPCLESLVQHNHYSFGRSAFDDTYRKTIARADYDQHLYNQRKALWNK